MKIKHLFNQVFNEDNNLVFYNPTDKPGRKPKGGSEDVEVKLTSAEKHKLWVDTARHSVDKAEDLSKKAKERLTKPGRPKLLAKSKDEQPWDRMIRENRNSKTLKGYEAKVARYNKLVAQLKKIQGTVRSLNQAIRGGRATERLVSDAKGMMKEVRDLRLFLESEARTGDTMDALLTGSSVDAVMERVVHVPKNVKKATQDLWRVMKNRSRYLPSTPTGLYEITGKKYNRKLSELAKARQLNRNRRGGEMAYRNDFEFAQLLRDTIVLSETEDYKLEKPSKVLKRRARLTDEMLSKVDLAPGQHAVLADGLVTVQRARIANETGKGVYLLSIAEGNPDSPDEVVPISTVIDLNYEPRRRAKLEGLKKARATYQKADKALMAAIEEGGHGLKKLRADVTTAEKALKKVDAEYYALRPANYDSFRGKNQTKVANQVIRAYNKRLVSAEEKVRLENKKAQLREKLSKQAKAAKKKA